MRTDGADAATASNVKSTVNGVVSVASTVKDVVVDASKATFSALQTGGAWVANSTFFQYCAMVPGVVGTVCGSAQAVGYALNGQWAEAALAGAGMLPGAAVVAGGAKALKTLKQAEAAATTASRYGDDITDAALSCTVGGGRKSFAGDTPVLLANGTTKPIDQIKVGDQVLATNPESGEQGPRTVTHTWIHLDDLYQLEINGELIVVTEDHPIWSMTDHTWEDTQDLDTGEHVLTANGTTLPVTHPINPDTAAAYNLTIDGIHTYYVLAGNESILVHNSGGVDWDAVRNNRDGRYVDDDDYNTPRDHERQNRQFDDAVDQLGRERGIRSLKLRSGGCMML
ncbi:polymorphic toxin-type HINT domain-containing protein [Frankia nepalensis]|uniref:polymorphic toxin-type HINT domain-containing protein n=2 Tax=Frankia nepalensis TaxID=1836974 RepID=UPI0019314E32|nr:polymorphic toxin-type HINT domain-containing protein [Frankia nepalensis]